MERLSSAAYVTAVLHFLQAFNRNDLDDCQRFLDPDVEWHSAISYKGRREVCAMLGSLTDRFSRPQARPEDFRESAGHVLMIVCFYEADQNVPPRELRQSWIAQMTEDGHMGRVISYPSPAEAARALDALAVAGT